MRSIFRQLGHGATLDAGGVPDEFVEWGVALQRHTDTMRNELATMSKMGSFRGGFDPRLTVGRDLLSTITSPTYFLWGSEDPYGDEMVARRVVDAMPAAQLEMLSGAGHLCWLDDPDHAAAAVTEHLLACVTR